MNAFLYSLLIDLDMDNFTIKNARDALIQHHDEFIDPTETRKFVYRQLLRQEEKGYLSRSKSQSKDITYLKTDKFFEASFKPKRQANHVIRASNDNSEIDQKSSVKINFIPMLEKEIFEYEMKLDGLLEEAEHYKNLTKRLPHLKDKFEQQKEDSKKASTKLIGMIKATKYAISLQKEFEGQRQASC